MTLLIKCPHCNLDIEVLQIACGIFRCGIYKKDYRQIPPHSNKTKCDKLKNENLIFGCGKPFHINTPDRKPVKCGYI